MSVLETIHGHADLALLDETNRIQLCQEIRDFLISNVSKTGGHLASNLGVVELTVAIETVFNTQNDRLVFDVGHQSYIHKLLTDRQADFSGLRQFGGMAGFPKPSESITDSFVAGHASSSISIALGMARARTLTKQDYHVLALIGDGAATGGMVYEGLNDAAVSGEPMIVILNDNEMSIDKNVGGISKHLSRLRTKKRYLILKERYGNFLLKLPFGSLMAKITRNIKNGIRSMLIPTTIFQTIGFKYLGPVDGHDTENLIELLKLAKELKSPVLLHVITQKGRGFEPAEQAPQKFHGVGKFDPVTGAALKASSSTFSDAFGKAMCQLAQEEPRLCAITAAMPGGTGLLPFGDAFPDRLFDVGIAEEHAVSMAGGLAKQGMIPVIALYSTFLQRSYDMILQDICMLGLHVVFAVDRAGLVGEDGETHHGVFDVGFLRQAPGLKILSPASELELQQMLYWAVKEQNGPVAIRYPRGGNKLFADSHWGPLALESAVSCHKDGKNVALVTYGTLLHNVMEAATLLEEKSVHAKVLRLLSLAPLPVDQLIKELSGCEHVIIIEEISENCGIASELAWQISHRCPGLTLDKIDLGYGYITHGGVDKLYETHGMDPSSIANFVMEVHHFEN